MSRPGPLPTAPDHELHDPLLVAQLAAGDPLDPHLQAQARSMVGNCGACSALARDLGALSSAVAWEPVPPRRRDFRISEAQAAELRGGLLARLMRRAALPPSRSLRPAAAGLMSLGLLFIVAGTVWPDGDVSQVAQPEPAPQAVEEGRVAPTGGLKVLPPAGVFADDASLELEASAAEAPPAADDGAVDLDRALNQKAARTRDSASDELIESYAAAGSAPAAEAQEPMAVDALAVDAVAGEVAEDGAARLIAPSPSAASVVLESRVESPDADDATPEAGIRAAVDPEQGLAIETVLLALGALLAVGGALLLVLIWLARRQTDPLLR